MSRGLVLEKVIYDRRTSEFSLENSDFFWFTVLRKVYMKSMDPSIQEQSKTMYKSLASYLEENLYRETEQYGKIARTAALFLAVENRDKVTVEKMLDDFPNRSHFYKHMRTIPGQIFPKDVFLQHPINVSCFLLFARTMLGCSNYFTNISGGRS